MIAKLVYLLCFITSAAAAGLLIRSYVRTRTRLALWSSICFLGLAINNVLLFTDLVLVPNVDLALARALVALASISVLVFGLIADAD